MKIFKQNKNKEIEIIQEAVKVLRSGGLIIYPTETVYGVGVDVTNKKAVAKLFKYKERREGKPISIAVADKRMAMEYVEINEIANNLYENYLPGPFTVVSKGLNKVCEGIQSEFQTLGIRIPNYELILKIIKKFGKPISATSANMSYKPKPYSIKQLLNELPQKNIKLIDLIIDAGKLPKNEPSTVVDTTLNNLNIMRQGQYLLNQEIGGEKPVLKAQTNCAKETREFGGLNMLKFIDTPLEKPLVFLLSGELGSGKTQFTKGIAKKLTINFVIKSPTYNILNEYDYSLGKRKGKLVHIDTWRIKNVNDLKLIELKSYLKKNNIIVIEWADKFLKDIQQICKKRNALILNVIFKYINKNKRIIETFLLK